MAIAQKPPIPRAFISEEGQDAIGRTGQVLTEPWQRFFRDVRADIDAAPIGIPSGPVAIADGNDAVAATTILTTEHDGLYSFQYFAAVITADGVSSSLTPAIGFTQNGVAKSKTFSAMNGNTTTTTASEDYLIVADGGTPITYTLTYASNTPNAMHYSFYAMLSSVAST